MQVINYPDERSVKNGIEAKEPLLMLVSFDGKTVIISHIDEAVEHHVLLLKAGFSDRDVGKYFRLVVDEDGADWTFVCPPDYKNIFDKTRCIKQFYKDGFSVISNALCDLGFGVGINIPKRYRWHFDAMSES